MYYYYCICWRKIFYYSIKKNFFFIILIIFNCNLCLYYLNLEMCDDKPQNVHLNFITSYVEGYIYIPNDFDFY